MIDPDVHDAVTRILAATPANDADRAAEAGYLAVLTARVIRPGASYAELGSLFKVKLTATDYAVAFRNAMHYAATLPT